MRHVFERAWSIYSHSTETILGEIGTHKLFQTQIFLVLI